MDLSLGQARPAGLDSYGNGSVTTTSAPKRPAKLQPVTSPGARKLRILCRLSDTAIGVPLGSPPNQTDDTRKVSRGCQTNRASVLSEIAFASPTRLPGAA